MDDAVHGGPGNPMLLGDLAQAAASLAIAEDGFTIEIERTPADVVIDRLCGDAPPEYLIGPQWCLDKAAVLSAIEAEFRRRGSRQGNLCHRLRDSSSSRS